MKLIGIGIGVLEGLSLQAWEEMLRAEKLVLQTGCVPLAQALRQKEVPFETLDDLYDSAEDFDALYEQAAARLRGMPQASLCLLGNLAQNRFARALMQQEGLVESVLPGLGCGEGALGLCAGQIEPGAAVICPAYDLEQSGFSGATPIAVTELDNTYLAADVFSLLSRYYPPDAPCHLVRMGRRRQIALCQLPAQEDLDYSTVLVLDKAGFEQKACYDFRDFCGVIARLRGENGCPWDREQTHESLRTCLIEECYEVLEAIQNQDDAALADELGDVLLQVVMHAAIASEHGSFDILSVTDGVSRKMIRRHPHIFAGAEAKDSQQVLKNWEEIKRREKAQSSLSQSLADLPSGLPALMRAQKLQRKMAQIGFDWEDYRGALEKLREETQELLSSLEHKEALEEEAGDLLFSAVNLLRKLGVDAETALLAACRKFAARVEKMENFAREQGEDLAKMTLEQQNCLWNAAKMCKKTEKGLY